MEEVQKVLSERVDILQKAYKDYQNNPYHPKTAHAIRVNSRKLRSLLDFMKKTLDTDFYDELNGELKALAEIYSTVRELDVLIELCETVALENPDLSEHYKKMFKFLHQERRREMNRTFNKTNVRNAETAIEAVETGVQSIFDGEAGEVDWSEYVTDRLKKKRENLKKDYKNLDRNDYETVHEVRKKAKKLRFSARYFGKLADVKHKKIAKESKSIQDEFGKFTDAHVNSEILESYAEKTEDQDLKDLFLKINDIQQA
ncbi:CHAD domain-containing protein [Salinicoccus albus]|uniref:CHAD domain-containing protein n=1 Tax=Salinicoccus albus TaxID=418756 RepID=UPI000360FCE4|nr:CHAD domain-containing protein [Salinicoccus albus]